MDKPNFALLIGKKSSPSKDDHAADLGMDDEKDEGMDQDGAEDSAVKDLMMSVASKDVQGFKSALKDFLEICYPSLSSGDEKESSDSDSDEEQSPDDAY